MVPLGKSGVILGFDLLKCEIGTHIRRSNPKDILRIRKMLENLKRGILEDYDRMSKS